MTPVRMKWPPRALRLNRHVVSALGRVEALIRFVRARLSRGGYFGLELTLGAVVLLAAAWLFGGIMEDVISGDPLIRVDSEVASWFEAHSVPSITQAMLVISQLHEPIPVTAIVCVLALLLLWRRQWLWVLALMIVVPGGALLNALVKEVVHRPRPHFGDLIVTLMTYSFPSGHTSAATLLYGFMAAYAVVHIRAWRWRLLTIGVALVLVLLVGLSRIYLRVHYLSDVLGGMSEGVAWLALCLVAMNTLRIRLQTRAR